MTAPITTPPKERCCRAKKRYPDAASAYKARRDMRETHKGQRFDVYKCCHCHQWHIGHAMYNKVRSEG